MASREKHKDGKVRIKTKLLLMRIGQHEEKIKLDVVYIEHYSIILGME